MTSEDVLEVFEFFDSWEDRYTYIIDLGRKLEPMDDSDKVEANRIHGCQSNVWIKTEVGDEMPPKLKFTGDSDAQIVRGLVALIIQLYTLRTPQEILSFDIESFFQKLELEQHLSRTRAVGLHGMINAIRQTAAKYALN